MHGDTAADIDASSRLEKESRNGLLVPYRHFTFCLSFQRLLPQLADERHAAEPKLHVLLLLRGNDRANDLDDGATL